MSDLSKERVLQILKSRTVVNGIGKYQVKVTSVHPFEDKNIINVSAMNMFQAKQAREDLIANKLEDAANSNLSFSIFEGQDLPAKGEFINIQIGVVDLKSGEKANLIVGWSEIKASVGITNFNFEDSSADEEAVEAEAAFSQSELA